MCWGITDRSYPISKSQGISKMVSAFKEYNSKGLCLVMSAAELTKANTVRSDHQYTNETPMLPLAETPGLRIIDPTKAGDGYWNYEKIAYQTQDVMHAMSVLKPDIQQLHQYNWSSGHKKSKEGGLAVSSMNLNYGGKGGKSL